MIIRRALKRSCIAVCCAELCVHMCVPSTSELRLVLGKSMHAATIFVLVHYPA